MAEFTDILDMYYKNIKENKDLIVSYVYNYLTEELGISEEHFLCKGLNYDHYYIAIDKEIDVPIDRIVEDLGLEHSENDYYHLFSYRMANGFADDNSIYEQAVLKCYHR